MESVNTFAIVIGFILLLLVAVWIYSLIDIVRSNFKNDSTKLIWIVLVCVGQAIGPLLWFLLKDQFIIKPKADKLSAE